VFLCPDNPATVERSITVRREGRNGRRWYVVDASARRGGEEPADSFDVENVFDPNG
jgi:hypothetical protein